MMDTNNCTSISARDLALKHFCEDKFHCAESVFLAVSQSLGYDPLPHLQMVTPFGGGIAGTQAICGVITGGLMAIGLALGRKDPSGDRKLPDIVSKDFIMYMEAEFHTITCRTLTGVDFSDPKQKEAFHQPGSSRTTVCNNLVAKASEFLVERITLALRNGE